MDTKISFFDSVCKFYEVNDVSALEFSSVSITTIAGQYIASWAFDPGVTFDHYILLMPYEVDVEILEDSQRKVYLHRLNPFTDEIYHIIPKTTVTSMGDLRMDVHKIYDSASGEWLDELSSKADGHDIVEPVSDNVVQLNPSKKLH